jgi:hypothetical protein
VFRAKHGDGGKVRLRDRSLSIFGEWARKRGRRPSAVLHLIMEDGARVDGLSEEAEIADYIGRRFGADRNVRVISRVWSDREFADAILPEVIGEAPGSQA